VQNVDEIDPITKILMGNLNSRFRGKMQKKGPRIVKPEVM